MWAEKIYTKQGVVKEWDKDKGQDTDINNEKRKTDNLMIIIIIIIIKIINAYLLSREQLTIIIRMINKIENVAHFVE